MASVLVSAHRCRIARRVGVVRRDRVVHPRADRPSALHGT